MGGGKRVISIASEKALNTFVSIAASVVIVGALFKIQHLPGAGIMLTVGLLTEAAIFLIYGIISVKGYGIDDLGAESHDAHHPPKEKEIKHQQMMEMKHQMMEKYPPIPSVAAPNHTIVEKQQVFQVSHETSKDIVDKMVPGIIEKLGKEQINVLQKNLMQINETVSHLKNMGEVVSLNKNFNDEIRKATNAFSEIGDVITHVTTSLSQFKKISETMDTVCKQTKILADGMASVNRVYEKELYDTTKHLKQLNVFYDNLAQTSESLKEGIGEAKQTKQQISMLTQNLAQLNFMYASMISSMRFPMVSNNRGINRKSI